MSENNIQKQLAKLRRNKKFLWLSILFLVLIIIWILTSIFATTKTSAISQELRDLSKPFVPRLESKFFDEILSKRAFSAGELDGFSIFIVDKNNIESNGATIDIMALPEESEEFDEQVVGESDFAAPFEEVIQDPASVPAQNLEDTSATAPTTAPTSVPTSPTTDPSATTPFIEFVKENY